MELDSGSSSELSSLPSDRHERTNQSASEECSSSNFRIPIKMINSSEEFELWKNSDAYKSFSSFIIQLSESVHEKKISDPCIENPITHKIILVLDEMDVWISEIPPTHQPTRFGNKAFRTWFSKVEKESERLNSSLLSSELQGATIELAPMLVNSIGNYTRIDYGSGHEAAFLIWLFCLKRLGILLEEDHQAIVTRIFARYLKMVRNLQRIYLLEPAGSHGVWGLDDYQFLPFLFGSSQLIGHPYIKPNSIHNSDIVNSFSEEYLYLGCIQFINQMKKGPFGEHSPYLNDISYVPHQLWEKVNAGMIKMYHKEVLCKFVVIQHFLFGSIFALQ